MKKVRNQREKDRGVLNMLHAPAHRSQFNAFTVEPTKITIKNKEQVQNMLCCVSVRGEQPHLHLRERSEFICGLQGGNLHNDMSISSYDI